MTLFHNARAWSLVREGEWFQAFTVDAGGRIRELFPPGAPLPPLHDAVDLGGATVLPAFTDTHVHLLPRAILGALGVRLVRLEADPSGGPQGARILPDRLDGLLTALEEAARTRPRGPLVGYGALPAALAERRLPTDRELDRRLPGRQVFVFAMDGHSSSYSTAALHALGLGHEARDGVLRGEAHEFNMGRVTGHLMRSVGPRTLARGLGSAVEEALAGGLSGLHCLEGFQDSPTDASPWILSLLGPGLPLKLTLYLQYTEPRRVARAGLRLRRPRVGGCMAWEMDGSILSRTAAMDRPYRDGAGLGSLYRSPQEALDLARPFYGAGCQVSAHGIGPRGIESALRAWEDLLDQARDTDNRHRLRIEHFELPRPDQVERAGRRRLVVAMQPGFAWADARWLGAYPEALEDRDREWTCPLRSLVDAGAVVTLSTDAPVQDLNPFIQVAGAVDHPHPSQRLTVWEALRAYTWGGAFASFEEDQRGTLAPGMAADFMVLDRDPFAIPPSTLDAVKVRSTWIDGRRARAPSGDLAGLAGTVARSLMGPWRTL